MIIRNFLKLVLLIILILTLVLPGFRNFVLGEEDLEAQCLSENIEASEKKLSRDEYQKMLEKCLKYFEEKSAEYEKKMKTTKQKERTLQNEIYYLKNKIAKLDNQIYQSNLMIKDLALQIADTQTSIDKTSSKIEESKEELAAILRTIYEEQQKSLVEILLQEDELSDFFDNLVALEMLNTKNKELLENIKELKNYLEEQKQSLDEEKRNIENLVVISTLQRQQQQQAKQEKDWLLKLTESEYQNYLKEKKRTEKIAGEIRARIFELIGVPKAPTFGEALELAKYVERITGVRPAFLLAVLAQESSIGKNVGQCYLKNFSTGEGIVAYNGKGVSRVMNPKRDIPHFLKITKELGRDPKNTLVSCPMSYGWGGAMGPAQFIPSTWMIYRERVTKITGKTADPWNIKDAFLAAALYLADYGAARQTYNAEWRAAMIYFSGTTKRTRYNGYGFYGDSVMSIAARYQTDIETIESIE
ncbi:hypothetical protein DRO54_10380 [Candidatus Bathyarchaeota archaeon]|nr:MAG: hypothetical protein DRO54_10380 [Candidatus Bathyarchaeota archaeon]